jgi:hypothetical protein
VQFMTWNLSGAMRGLREAKVSAQLQTLRELNPDILAAQELTPAVFARIRDSGLFLDAAFSLDEPDEGTESSRCEYGCALFSRMPLRASRRVPAELLVHAPHEKREAARDLTLLGSIVLSVARSRPLEASMSPLRSQDAGVGARSEA